MQSNFNKVPERPDFPLEEAKVLEHWKDIDAFHESMRRSQGKKLYTFYDGPPFATGLPHYGHIAAGTIKDVMTRYATQTGHHCERRFGWDCHGLPIEYEIDKRYDIKSSVEREAIGVKEYNRRCREIVMTYSAEWERVIGRFGRWIDFRNDYKTMDASYMESVWWAFKQIFDKGLVYRGSRIMPFSPACNTVLSNFEAGSNYKDTKDPAVFVTFPLVDEPATSLVAWTTTPWTLPSNLAVAVNPEFTYLKIHDTEKDKVYLVAEPRLKDVLKQCKIKTHKVLEKLKGKDLVGKAYTPLFDYFKSKAEDGCFRIIPGDFVTTDAGTGVVHCAPGFGEQDYAVCLAQGLVKPGGLVMPMDADGKFLDTVPDYAGVYFKDADPLILKDLKAAGRLVASGTVVHSYPFCWRSQQPLMYRATDTWFIKVTEIKDQLLKNNEGPRWVPSFVQEKRFKNWLADARDWCFSRSRYWGNPIPLWVSDDMEEVVCVGSVAELQELSGCGPLPDLHRECVDHITIPSKMGKGVLRRVPEVFDCWFESGSMPYASKHYPFSLKDEEFNKGFPANFIAEGLDQTRGWFYTLMVISTAVKGVAPFKNVIVNGIVLAEDGSKMSKSKQNYPDPLTVAEEYGADACRLYLCNSPVVRAESLQFREVGVKGVVREVFLPWFNAYRFLIQNISRYEQSTGEKFLFDRAVKAQVGPGSNLMDRWIVSATQNLIKLVRAEMDSYHLYNVVRPLLSFLDQLTNWYVRLNRPRMRGDEGQAEALRSLTILFDVLLSTSTLMACITPFLTEHMYQNLRNGLREEDKDLNQPSIHFLQIPEANEALVDEGVERRVARMQSAIENGRLVRERKAIGLKTPLASVTLVDADPAALQDFQEVAGYIKEELNCLELITAGNEDAYLSYKCLPDNKLIGGALKKAYDKKLKAAIEKLSSAQLRDYLQTGSLMLGTVKIESGWLKVVKEFNAEYQNHADYAGSCDVTSSALLRTALDDNLKRLGQAREMTNRIQKLRKSSGISIDDQIEVFYTAPAQTSALHAILSEHSDRVKKAIKMPFASADLKQPNAVLIAETTYEDAENEADKITLFICKPAPQLDEAKITADFPGVAVSTLRAYLSSFSTSSLEEELSKNGNKLSIKVDGKDITLEHKKHLWLSVKDRHGL